MPASPLGTSDEGVSGESYEMRHFRVVFVLKGGRAGPSWVAEVAGDGKNERIGSNSVGWMYNRRWPGGQNGNAGSEAKPGQGLLKPGVSDVAFVDDGVPITSPLDVVAQAAQRGLQYRPADA